MISEAAEAKILYYALEDDLDTVDYFLDFHEIGLFPKNVIYPITDRLVFGQEAQSEAQSESENPCRDNSFPDCRKIP